MKHLDRQFIVCVFLGGVALGLVLGYGWHFAQVATNPHLYITEELR
jgi:hypothetical protein